MKKIIIFLIISILFTQTAAASASFPFPSPKYLEFPGRIESDFSQTYAFIGHNNSNVTEYFSFNSSENGGLEYTAANRFYSNNHVRFAVLDWAHPYRMFLVFDNLDVAYTDSFGVIYENGYYTLKTWPLTGCDNCNDLHKIGVIVTPLNTKMSGFVDSDGNFYVSEGLKVVKFTRQSDFAKTTYLTVSGYQDKVLSGTNCGQASAVFEISDMRLDADNNIHTVLGALTHVYCTPGYSQGLAFPYNHMVYQNGALVYQDILGWFNASAQSFDDDLRQTSILPINNPNNTLSDVVWGRAIRSVVYLTSWNGTVQTDICPGFCDTITGFGGVQILGGYAYIPSAAENKIYRYPTTIVAANPMGFGGGALGGAGVVDYTTKTVNFEYPTIYNNTEFRITYDLKFTINDTTKTNQGQNMFWNIRTTNPTGAPISAYDITPVCEQAQEWWTIIYNPLDWSCHSSASFYIEPPATNWSNGTYTTRMYETVAGVGSILASDTSTVLNESGFTGVTTPGTTPPGIITIAPGEGWGAVTDENSKSHTVDILDNWVGTLGMGINNTTRLWFAVIVIIFAVIVGALIAKDTIVSVACGFLPFAFFASISLDPAAQAAGIEFIPKWAIAMFIIILALAVKVLR